MSIYYGSSEGEAPALSTGLNLAQALVTDGDNMSKLPGGDVPVSTGGTTGTWGENAASVSISYANKGTSNNLTWAYDPAEPDVWVEQMGTDTKGNSVHGW